MGPDIIRHWTCDAGERFEDDRGLARQLARRIDEHREDRLLFAREGCMFRLTYEDMPLPANMIQPVDPHWRSRTYRVTLLPDSPTCAEGHPFTDAWPDGYNHPPVEVVAPDAPSDAPVIMDGTMNDILHVLAAIGVVLWPESYDL